MTEGGNLAITDTNQEFVPGNDPNPVVQPVLIGAHPGVDAIARRLASASGHPQMAPANQLAQLP